MNIRYNKEILVACRTSGLKCVGFSRKDEPARVKQKEGSSLEWGLEQAIRKNKGRIPDIVFDEGEKGKEPMIRIFGKNALEVAQKVVRIAEKYEKRRG
jgi:hydroxymethylpyrimidine/phosphomethylpyrimidine kinase